MQDPRKPDHRAVFKPGHELGRPGGNIFLAGHRGPANWSVLETELQPLHHGPIPQRLTPQRHAGLEQSTAALQLPHWGGADPSAPAAKASVAAADSAVLKASVAAFFATKS